MAAEVAAVSEKVQNYTDQHKLTTLFEDLKSKVLKELPLDPIEFLINKLQALQKQKKKGVATPRPATSSGVPSSKARIQVTGTTVAPASKLKGPSTAKSKAGLSSTSSPSLTKPSSRPTSGSSSPKPASGTRLKPTSSASTTPKRPTTAPASAKSSPTKSTGLKTPSKLSTSSSSASSASKPSPTKSHSGLKPPTTGPGKAATTVRKATTLQASKDKSKPLPKKGPEIQTAKKAKSELTPVKTKKESAPGKTEAKAEEVVPIIGEVETSSIERDRDNDELSVPSVGGEESDSEAGVRCEDSEVCDCEDLSLQSLLQLKMSKKQGKGKHSSKKTRSHLRPKLPEDDLSTTPPSLGYHSESGDGCEESEEDDCVEAVEDPTTLEDEGVTGLPKHSANLPRDAQVDFMVLLCSRCAKMLTGDEPKAEMSAIVVTKGAASDFESASQVGSHTSFPQWEVGTEADSDASSVNKWASSSETTTNITLVSRDTWGGLAPKTRPTAPETSEEDSEVQLPPPPPLESRPWREESPHDPHGWGNGSN